MRFHPTLPMTAALAAMVVLAGAVAYYLLSDEVAVHPGNPRYAANTVSTLNATIAPVGDFDKQFNTVLDNPFLPYKARLDDKRLHLPHPPVPPPSAQTGITVIQPAAPDIPKLVLPPAAARGPEAPECHGLMTVGDNQMLMVRMPGSDDLQQITIGDEVPEPNSPDQKWKLLGFVAGALARWQAPDGTEQIFPVANGLNDTVGTLIPDTPPPAPTPATAAAPARFKNPPGGKPDVPAPGPMVPKRPRPGPQNPKKS